MRYTWAPSRPTDIDLLEAETSLSSDRRRGVHRGSIEEGINHEVAMNGTSDVPVGRP